jgi:NADPH-dependent ferric siderophore reductase
MSRIEEKRMQTPVYMNARACDIKDITPHLRRISLKHELLKEIELVVPGAHFKVLIPPVRSEQAILPDLSSGRPYWSDQKNKPIVRTYTVRNLDCVKGILDVEFVIHGETGLASAWATKASVNDFLGLGIKNSGKTNEMG